MRIECPVCGEVFKQKKSGRGLGRPKTYCSRRCLERNATLKRRSRVRGLKGDTCMDCGGVFPPCVLDFDHRPDEEKLFNIGTSGNRALALIEAEVVKCDVVCANCHRIRTFERGYAQEYSTR